MRFSFELNLTDIAGKLRATGQLPKVRKPVFRDSTPMQRTHPRKGDYSST